MNYLSCGRIRMAGDKEYDQDERNGEDKPKTDTAALRSIVSGYTSPNKKAVDPNEAYKILNPRMPEGRGAVRSTEALSLESKVSEMRDSSEVHGADDRGGEVRRAGAGTRPERRGELNLAPTKPDTSDDSYNNFLNRTSKAIQMEDEERRISREHHRSTRSAAAVTVKQPARSAIMPDDRELTRAGKRGEHFGDDTVYFDDGGEGSINLLEYKYVALGVIAGALIVLVLLTFFLITTSRQLSTVKSELKAAEDRIAAFNQGGVPSGDAATETIRTLNEKLAEKDEKIEELNKRIEELDPDSSKPVTSPPPQGTPGPTAAPTTPPGSQTHTVVSGDNLFNIAQRYYGSSSQANIDRIFNANTDKMRHTGDLRIGVVLIIP
jgi:nucleoid-associated protein YgaU